jgi:2-polyprenyl-3-methyl-5-hydroxy-6-metoxy-1,4-benzoquinol methylase
MIYKQEEISTVHMKEHSESKRSGLEETYISHHTQGGRRDTTMFGKQRGEFLRSRIGTGKKILDIGCRDGELTKEYAAGNEVLGLDIDTEALNKAKQKLSMLVQKADLHADWGVERGVYDVVVAGEVLEHLYYSEVVIGKVKNALKQDGLFIGSVPNAFSLINRVRLFFGIKKGTPLSDPTHINHFKHSELHALLKKHFTEVSIVPLGKYAWLDKYVPGMFSFMLMFEARNKK